MSVALDTSLDITFSEPVNASGSWFSISCGISGTHTANTSGGPTTFTLDPDADFVNSETCTVTVFAAQVSDQDSDDPPDNMVADYVFTFETVGIVVESPEIIFTEIMYDPNSAEDNWEWIEIYNAGSSPVDLAGFVVDDVNSTAHASANISGGTLAAGEQGILFNADDVTASDFAEAWGNVNLIPVTNWFAMALNNGGDQVSLWKSFADYSGDNTTHANALDTVNYASANFPDPVGASIYLTDLSADNNVGSNWATSTDGGTTPLFTGYTSAAAGGNIGTDIGSPGTPVIAAGIAINEFSASTIGSPDVEYIEVFGNPGTDYSAFTILEIEGDSAKGNIDRTFPVGTTDAGGFWTTSVGNLSIENGSITLLLVEGFTGSTGDDIDADDDGSIDFAPWTRIVDDVAVFDGGAGDLMYSSVVLGPNYDGLTSFAPGGASRIPDGADTGSATDWVRNDFDLFGIPGFSGSPSVGEAENTPGATNVAITVITDPIGVCGDPATLIHDIQGNGLASSDVGSIREVEAVVVATFQGTDQIGGYFIQEEDADADGNPLTSEGLRIFDTGNTPDVGELIRIRGSVTEYFDLTEINNVTDYALCGSGVATPATVTLPVSSMDDFEKYEGMAVTFPQALVISEYFNFDRFGEIVLTSERHLTPTAEFEPGTPEVAQAIQDFLLDKITLDDGRGNQNPDPAIHPNGGVFDLTNLFRGGDTVQNVTGVMDYNFGAYKIQPTQGADYTNVNLRPAQPDDVGGNLKVASFNVLNYFTTLDDGVNDICGPLGNQECRGADDANEFTRQRDKIIAALSTIDADVVGLIEIENHPADVPTADLVSGLNVAMGAGTYDYIATGAFGTDAIRQAFIYKPATVSPLGGYAVLDDPSFTDPLGYGEEKSRPALAQTFMANDTGGVFTAVINHLKSKGSACGPGDDDPEQGSCNQTRVLGAQALVDWLATDPTNSGDPDYLILGDLNSYDKEDPIDVFVAGGYTDLLLNKLGEDAYSYVFDGQIGYLDYSMPNQDLLPEISGVTAWHINADEADLIDYDTSFKQDAQDAIYAPDAYRSSDHDPVISGLELTTEAEIIELINDVQKLFDDGVLNEGQANALTSKLENVLDKLARENSNAAANQLGAFINQIEDFVYEGILTTEQGDHLIKAATLLIGVLSD
jgi:predicted extracellular nuclease